MTTKVKAVAVVVAVALMVAVGVAISRYFPNLGNNAPLQWTSRIEESEQVCHADADSVYCAAAYWARDYSLSSLSRIDRHTGERRWMRRTETNSGPPAYSESVHIFTAERCYLATSRWDWNAKANVGASLVSVMLQDGKTEWENPVAGELGAMTLSDGILYTISHKGMVAAYEPQHGRELWRLDLGPFNPQANHGSLRRAGNALVVGCHLSHDYTNRNDSKSILIDLRSHQRILQTERGTIFGTQLFTWPQSGLACYDLDTLSPVPSTPQSPLSIFPMEASDSLEPLLVGREHSGDWRRPPKIVDPHRLRSVDIDNIRATAELRYVSDNTAYFSDYRHLVAIDRASGKTHWTADIENAGDMMVSDTLVATMSRHHQLVALDARNGARFWSWHTRSQLPSPYCDGNTIFITDGLELRCFDSSALLRDKLVTD